MELDITWIVGNGFDINLGLHTGYKDFLNNCYMRADDTSGHRRRLVRRLQGDPQWSKAEFWSDLEELLGYSSKFYEVGEQEEFIETFEEMEDLFIDYVRGEELRMPAELSSECVDEFKDSVAHFDRRMAERDRGKFDLQNMRESHVHHFVSLNYTDTLDRFVAALQRGGRMGTHVLSGTTFADDATAPFHLHGGFDDDGHVRGIVFGVDSADQIANKDFSEDPEFQELWIKTNENSGGYANNNESRLVGLIAQSQVFCIYGCSLGESDSRIWHAVADRMKTQSTAKLVLFVYELPDRHSLRRRKYQRVRSRWLDNFKTVSRMSDSDFESVSQRIFFVRSSDYFKMDGLIDLAPLDNA